MSQKTFGNLLANDRQSGAALVIALVVMAMLLGFVALVLSRTVAETVITTNDTAESRTFNAAEAALEDATRDFATVVENKFIPPPEDVLIIKNKPVPYFSNIGYSFVKNITQLSQSKTVTQTKGKLQGLVSLRDEWQIDVTATDTTTGVVTQVKRRFFNDRIPIFQFGAFYQDDLEVNDPPLFIFNGRVHTNGNFFTNSNGNGIYFKSKITVAGEIVRDRWRSGAAQTAAEQSNEVYAPNATSGDIQMPNNRGSVTCSSTIGGGVLTDVTGKNFPYPNCTANSNWTSFSQGFEGNVVTHASQLNLPISKTAPFIEMMRRGKNVGDKANIGGSLVNVTAATTDNGVLSRERYANKEGIRISLADSKEKLPQCATATGACGVRLDADFGGSRGYQPLSMTDGYAATAVNGNRLAINGREVWIKVELVDFDYDYQKPITKDITQDFLSLGVTEPIIKSNTPTDLEVQGYNSTTDSRSIIKLQRLAIEGDAIGNPTSTSYITSQSFGSSNYNFAVRLENIPSVANNGLAGCLASPFPCTGKDVFAPPVGSSTVNSFETAHYKMASFNNGVSCGGNCNGKTRVAIVPFPIQMFDTREGNRADNATNLSDDYVFRNGVMSVVDIDVANLKKFFDGDWDGKFPTTTPFAGGNGNVGLKSTNVPKNRGWVIYFTDRRGDTSFDGRYDMEDVNPNSTLTINEDLDGNNSVDGAPSSETATSEAPVADSTAEAGLSAVTDHKYYRRTARLINGSTLPGIYDATTEANTKGFTFASENGIYVRGNYNTTSVNVAGGSTATTSENYAPQNTTLHIPASVVGDAVTILSNSWNDGQSFAAPNNRNSRVASNTQVRFAMLAGDPISGHSPSAGLTGAQNGGLINFKRYLEAWSSKRLNYAGSLVNIFNAFNNNAHQKCCNTVYSPPTRDWTYDSSFNNPSRMPPGTPFVYYISFTGFERVNE